MRASRATGVAVAGTGAAMAALGLASPALAQEAVNMDAATQPSTGVLYIREQIRFQRYTDNPRENGGDVTRWMADTWLTYGLSRDVAVQVEIPLVHESWERAAAGGGFSDDETTGLGDPAAFFKYRFLSEDLGPVDTVRASALAGVEAPLGTGSLSSHSWDPFAGVVATGIFGRHGVNAGVRYKINTGSENPGNLGGDGPADALDYDLSYLYRLSPAEWATDTKAAVYGVVELNGLYETNGDNEIVLAPGLLYEAKVWAAELTLQLPIAEDVDDRPELDWGIGFGLRLTF